MKAVPVMAIVGAAFAGVGALILVDPAQIVLALVAIGIAIAMMVMHRELPSFVLGGASIVLSILGALWVVGNVSGEDGGIDFGGSPELGHAVLVIALLAAAGLLLWAHFDEIAMWAKVAGGAGIVLTVALAIGFRVSLGDQSGASAFIVAFASALTLALPIERLRA